MKRAEPKTAARGRRETRTRASARRGMGLVRVSVLATVMILVAGAAGLTWRHWDELEPRLNPPLTRVELDGELRRLSVDEVKSVLEPYAGRGFFDLDLKQAREQVESLQWIEAAAVGRRWPDTLRVRITEETVIARWGEDQLTTRRGKIISPDLAEIDPSLPQLGGPPDSHFEVMRQYQSLNQILYPAGLRLSGLDASPRRSWRLQLNGVTEVVLGSEDLVNRLQRYVEFYGGQPEQERLRHEVVDLRYGSQFSIRFREVDSGAGLARR